MSGKLRKLLVMAAGVLVISAATVTSGCHANISGTESDRMVEYTVICGDAIPEEFKKQINENKAKAMKLTYKDDEYLYIAEGFGTKETGGYSITVNQFYVKDKAMYLDTRLIAPDKDEKVSNQASYPYIVIKTELSEMPVVFE